MRIALPYISIKPSGFCSYLRYDETKDHRGKLNFEHLEKLDNRSHGLMSRKANKRVSTAIDWLLYLSKDKPLFAKSKREHVKFKLNFVTLTLSSKQIHSDNEIKNVMLNQFLTELRTKYKCYNYLWRAESQANGNIHFHVCTDVFIPWRSLRTDWNRIQEKMGYVTRYTQKTGKTDPNSTDVHSINNVRNLGGYLAKYCTKNSKGYVLLATLAGTEHSKPKCFLTYKHKPFNPKAKIYRQIHGKLWGQSQNLSKHTSAKCEVTDAIQAEINFLQQKVGNKVKFLERASLYYISVTELAQRKCFSIFNKFLDYVNSNALNIITPKYGGV